MMDRKYKILKQVIEQFILSAKPIGSNCFKNCKTINTSSATIRNEMAILEKEGLLSQPHTSAGRIPTAKGYKHFVENLMDTSEIERKKLFEEFKQAERRYFIAKVKEKVYDGISILSQMTENVAFATIPENRRTLFLGVANLLKQPEFSQDSISASGVIEVLEQGFFEAVENLLIDDQVEIHIGENNIFPHIQSCSLMYCQYVHLGFTGIMGIVGPMRMNYPRNKVLIEYTKIFIEGQKLLSTIS